MAGRSPNRDRSRRAAGTGGLPAGAAAFTLRAPPGRAPAGASPFAGAPPVSTFSPGPP